MLTYRKDRFMQDFVHLHVHTQYSLLDGQASVSRLVDKAMKDGMKGIAVTDHGNMFGIKDYTEERITQRIKGIAIDRGSRRRSAGEISLRIALEDSIKAQQSAGYARWAKLHNLKQAANSLNFITEHQIDSYEGLESRLAEISAANDAAASALKDAERRLGDMALLIKNLSAYKQLRPVALELRNAKDKAAFRRQHESQLILYEAAAKTLKEAGVTKLPNLYALKTEYKKLDAERERLSAQYSEAKQKLKEYGIVKQNIDSILRTAPGKEHRSGCFSGWGS